MITVHQRTDGQTDGQTDRQLIMAIPRYATLRAVKTAEILALSDRLVTARVDGVMQ